MGLAQVVTLSVDDSTIAENGTATITATLNSSQGTETVVSFSILGTSTLGTDYSVSYTGKNSVKLVKDGLGQAYSIAIDKNGDLYIVEKGYNRILKCPGGGLNTCSIIANNNCS